MNVREANIKESEELELNDLDSSMIMTTATTSNDILTTGILIESPGKKDDDNDNDNSDFITLTDFGPTKVFFGFLKYSLNNKIRKSFHHFLIYNFRY